ncbi:YceD family protein [Schaalia suimastitidis]|uniref:YceD family protein n=1 Tax=Schaalia suimastitidis TaxID=121163 RepID=UPI00042422E2|nr:DUF177 domain-containing protein [Schaalia suimastitidis]
MTEKTLVLSLIDLPRHIGARKAYDCVWMVPGDLGTPSMCVAQGSELPLSIEVTSVDNGVLVQVHTRVLLEGECVRCLDPVTRSHDVSAAEVFFESAPTDADDNDEFFLIGPRDTVDIEPMLRDAIVTLVDARPLCRPECPGLCSGCGEKWDDLPDDHEHVVIDPRMASLSALLDGMESKQ